MDECTGKDARRSGLYTPVTKVKGVLRSWLQRALAGPVSCTHYSGPSKTSVDRGSYIRKLMTQPELAGGNIPFVLSAIARKANREDFSPEARHLHVHGLTLESHRF